MNMRYAIHQKTLLYLLSFHKSSQNVSHEMPQHGVPELSCVCVCWSGRGTAKCLSCAAIILHHLMSYMTSGAPITLH